VCGRKQEQVHDREASRSSSGKERMDHYLGGSSSSSSKHCKIEALPLLKVSGKFVGSHGFELV